MAAGRTSRRSDKKQGDRRANNSRARWLGAGAVAAGLGVALATSQGVANADTTGDDHPSASSSDATPSTKADSARASAPQADADSAEADTDESADSDIGEEPASDPVESTDDDEPDAADGTEVPSDHDEASELKTEVSDVLTERPAKWRTADERAAEDEAAQHDLEFASTEQSPSPGPATPIDAADAGPRVAEVVATPVTWRAIVSDVLTWIGLPPLPSNSPIPALPVPRLLESLWLGVRQSLYTFNNRRPVAEPTVGESDSTTGVVVGQLNAVDYDGDALTYVLTTPPTEGSVTIDAAGNFVFTPSPDLKQRGGQDQFVVTVDDKTGNPPHLHGLLDLFGVVPPTRATIRVEVDPVNAAPTATVISIGEAHPQNGAITGVVAGADEDGDSVTYAVGTAPENGALTVDPVTGVWTYTPAFVARVRAAARLAPTEDKQDTFVLIATDGVAETAVPVTVAVVPPHNTVIATISVGNRPTDTAVTPDGAYVYVPVSSDDAVSVIDAASNTVVATVAVGAGPQAVDISPDGSRVYVVNTTDSTVSVIDTATKTSVDTIVVETSPRAIAISPSGSRAYVTNGGDDSVSVIDTATNQVIGTVAVGANPSGIVATPDGARLYIANEDDDSVSVLDTAANTLLTTIDLGRVISDREVDAGPLAITMSPGGDQVYVANYSLYPENSVSVIDTATHVVVAEVPVGIYYSLGAATSTDGAYAYVTTFPDNTVTVIDTATARPMAIIAVGNWPVGPSVSPDGSHIYVPNAEDGTVSVISVLPPGNYSNSAPTITSAIDSIDLQTGVSTGRVTAADNDDDYLDLLLAARPAKGTVVFNSSDGTWTYTPTLATRLRAGSFDATDDDKEDTFVVVASDGYQATPVIVTVNVSPLQINALDTIPVGGFPDDVAVSGDGSRVYVTNSAPSAVSVIDSTSHTVTAVVPVGRGVNRIAVTPDGSRAYVSDFVDEAVWVVDTVSNTVGSRIRVSNGWLGVAVSPVASQSRAYVATLTGVAVIDTVSNTVVGNIALPVTALDLAVSPDGARLYATLPTVDGVAVIDTATNTMITRQDVGDSPDDIAVSADGRFVYVASDEGVDVIEGLDHVGDVDTSSRVGGVAVTADGVAIFVTDAAADSVLVIDPVSREVVASVPVGDGPIRLAVSPDSTRVYVVNEVDATVTVIGLIAVQ
ncbi:beta-propeller fold lactonase family protein [Mycolicibacterium sp. BiH015]|uniref:beta-propeller fold lactonase family protein n=1 Tax=Mycolicibacterium sp. BiH015 TaxID=3018808 RepID=UPI0022E56478|nr:beta-propeller fold lactonase family protein [Mycolicibacterium sp. BiH015]MDA2890289.1 beta-propeller fold lactonase family protein [Mycolicibacterium sp. BiH015]